jgi:hypothetical protein
MGAFNINITGVGGHGCERKAKAGDKLHGRCGRFTCPDCMAYDFVQRMKQAGMVRDGEQAYSVPLKDGEDLSPAQLAAGGHVVVHTDASVGRYVSMPMRAQFTHWPDSPSTVVDDMLKNERKEGSF